MDMGVFLTWTIPFVCTRGRVPGFLSLRVHLRLSYVSIGVVLSCGQREGRTKSSVKLRVKCNRHLIELAYYGLRSPSKVHVLFLFESPRLDQAALRPFSAMFTSNLNPHRLLSPCCIYSVVYIRLL